ncbi:TolB family protein [Geodermatophilus maliterrae]|uniref:TolB family protein n=1 Tax=Geodermatophilus maliterrae TaxID=3162531 RepID=A0ABV3XIE4_9ACTN
MPTGKWLLTSITGAVLLPALAVALAPTGSAAGRPGAGAPTVPDRVGEYSHLTAPVSSSPPGRAVALFQHGFGVEFLDVPQAVVVGADDDVVRRVDLAEDRAGGETQGDPAPMLLSPDGTRIAVGDHDTPGPDLAVLDLTDGSVDVLPVSDGRGVLPLAWSPDGRRLAYLSTPGPTNPYGGVPIAGAVGLLDLGTGRATELPGASSVSTAAFAPDGSELAVQHSAAAGDALEVLSLDGAAPRTVALPAGHQLDGAAAWSPDGRLLAVAAADCPGMGGEGWRGCATPGGASGDGIAFVDATGAGGPTPAPLDRRVAGPGRVLGWSAADRVAVLVPDAVGDDVYDPDQHWVTEVPLDGSAPRRISAVPTSDGRYGVGRFQLATGLLDDLEVREAGAVDRGRWPLWLRLGAAAALGATAAGGAAVVLRRSRRRRAAR